MSQDERRTAARRQVAAGPSIGANTGIGALTGDISHGGVGVLHGDQYVNQYVGDTAATPRQVFEEGWRCLDAGMRGRAEELLGNAVQRGYAGQDAYYYWMLAIVSRRFPEDLTVDDWHRLRTAQQRAAGPAPDGSGPGPAAGPVPAPAYTAAARLVGELLGSCLGSRPHAAVKQHRELPERLRAVPEARRAEIHDHLRFVIQRVEQHALEADDAAKVEAARMAGDRTARVPLFFTPDPIPPHPTLPLAKSMWPDERETGNGLVITAAVLGAAGLVLGGVALRQFAVVGVVLAVLSVLSLLSNLPGEARRRALEQRLPEWAREERPTPPPPPLPPPAPGPVGAWGAPPAGPRNAPGVTAFRGRLALLARERYARARPPGLPAGVDWVHLTERERAEVVDSLACHYWAMGPPEALDWLLQVRAQQAARDWEAGRLRSLARHPHAVWRGMRRGLWLAGFAALSLVLFPHIGVEEVLTFLNSSGSTDGPDPEFDAALADIAGGLCGVAVFVAVGAYRRIVEVTVHGEDVERSAADGLEYATWSARLAKERPADAEIARWLDLDQRHLMRDMLGEHRMEKRAILCSFFVMEAAPGCDRARVRNGPPRHSAAVLKLFVLTTNGVWVSTWVTDLATGQHQGRRDFVFRFDSISSVVLRTVGVALAGRGAGPGGATPQEVLRLVLNNQQNLEIHVENDERLKDATADDPERLRAIALETSGVWAGFRILAALATEGEGWLDQRRDQARHAFLGQPPASGRGSGSADGTADGT